MSPTKRVAGAADKAAPAVVIDGSNKATDDYLEEKSEAPTRAMGQVPAMLGALSKRMHRMQVSQKEQVARTGRVHRSQFLARPWEWERG